LNVINKTLLTLPEATLTFHPTKANGEPLLTKKLWTGYLENSLRIQEQWRVLDVRPTGSRALKHRPLAKSYQISIERPWVMTYPELKDFVPGRGPMVLDVVWVDEQTGAWHRNVFYGVTIRDRSRAAQDVESGFTDAQVFDAEYFIADSGAPDVPVPEISATLPLIVTWQGETGAAEIYKFNPATNLFEEFTAGAATGLATIEYDPDFATGDLIITFDGEVAESLRVGVDGTILPAFITGGPVPGDLPRLDFTVGGKRIATLTKTALFAANLVDAAVPVAAANQFRFYAAGALKSALTQVGLATQGVTA
jgi:hypothetical protein